MWIGAGWEACRWKLAKRAIGLGCGGVGEMSELGHWEVGGGWGGVCGADGAFSDALGGMHACAR